MSHDDFDIPDLAAYLHLTPLQVTRLADRGKLPARRVGGQWRFSQAEIHHWFEDRIGVCDDDHQLAEMEDVLQQGAVLAAGGGSELGGSVSIARLLDPRCIAKPLPARTRRSVIEAMIDLAASTGLLWDPEKMRQAVHAREELHPTALDNGVALLHPRRPMPSILGESFLTFGVTAQGIPFGGSRGNLTDVFFLICSTGDREHLQILARISRLTADVSLLEQIRGAQNQGHGVEKEIHRLIEAAEIAFGE